MQRKFAVFDIDGTLIRWQLYHAMVDALLRQGIVDSQDFEVVRIARMNWKRRSGVDSFKEYEDKLVTFFDAALKGLPVHALEMAANTVFSEYKDQVYSYTRDLIRELQDKGYLILAISGSPSVVIKLVQAYYKFDDFAATEYPTKNGYLTGGKQLSVGKKGELLQDLITKHNLTTDGSVGVGDSEGDISMLEICDKAIAFNPSQRLLDHAKKQGWQVIVERKNVTYILNPSADNGSSSKPYVLSE